MRTTPLLPFALLLALCACQPQPPEKEQPPEPQARGALTETIQRPIERAEKVEVDVQEAADKQRAAIDAATGG